MQRNHLFLFIYLSFIIFNSILSNKSNLIYVYYNEKKKTKNNYLKEKSKTKKTKKNY